MAAMAATLAPAALATTLPLQAELITLSALIALVPGFTLTIAMSELAAQHWVAGMARLAGAMVTFLELGLGVGLGQRLIPVLGMAPLSGPVTSSGPPTMMLALALVLAPLAFTVLFQARPRDALWISITSWCGFVGARWGTHWLGPELGVLVGSLLVGLASNALARLRGHPASICQAPGIMLLVPGSIGFASVAFFLSSDVVSGMEAAFRMVIVATALVGGLLFANALFPARREL
jgi:uncharacterized membrane protein YjjB (DUF3815 family)